jgi:hypothetical protein
MKSTESMDWLKRGLIEMQTRELKERNSVRTRRMKESILTESNIHEELQCVFCNCYSYLSYIRCECTDKISCLDHSIEVKKKKERNSCNIIFNLPYISFFCSCVRVTWHPRPCT